MKQYRPNNERNRSKKKGNEMKKKEKIDGVVAVTEKKIKSHEGDMVNGNRNYAKAIETRHGAELQRIMYHLDKYKGRAGIPKFRNAHEMELVIEKWWNDCIEAERFPTKRGLALALGTTYDGLSDWRNGVNGEEFARVMKKTDEMIAEIDEQLVMGGVVNPVLYMFRAKNYHGLKDKQEHVFKSNTLEATKTKEELAEEYKLAIPEDLD